MKKANMFLFPQKMYYYDWEAPTQGYHRKVGNHFLSKTSHYPNLHVLQGREQSCEVAQIHEQVTAQLQCFPHKTQGLFFDRAGLC
jgi:hypothetical protein